MLTNKQLLTYQKDIDNISINDKKDQIKQIKNIIMLKMKKV